ncbi:MAG: nucleoside-diphosphate kinase [Conexivisphaerales archaeon]
MKNKTLVLVKPDAFARKLTGEVISRFEAKGFNLLEVRKLRMTKGQAEEFYSVHKGKPFYEKLVSSISAGPIVALVLEIPTSRDTKGRTAVEVVRLMVGATNPSEAAPGTLRGDLGMDITDNVVHASDSVESFVRESGVIFK